MESELIKQVRPFLLVLARDRTNLRVKLDELEGLGIPFLVICGENVNHANVRYRKVMGKWDAVNFGSQFIPPESRLIVCNDADTMIHFLQNALMLSRQADLIFCRVSVAEGSQRKFYRLLDPLRKRLPVAASGELILIRRRAFEHLIPIPPNTAEDTYLMFRALELGYRVRFCSETYVTTVRTRNTAEEQAYKLRTTLGVYQALGLTRPPPVIRAFYLLLPLAAPLLALVGADGWAWVVGIERATMNHFLKRYATKF